MLDEDLTAQFDPEICGGKRRETEAGPGFWAARGSQTSAFSPALNHPTFQAAVLQGGGRLQPAAPFQRALSPCRCLSAGDQADLVPCSWGRWNTQAPGDAEHWEEKKLGDFPGGAVVKNPPANAGDTGSNPGPGRSHMLRGN